VSAYKNQLLKVNMKKMIRFLSVTAVLATAAAAAQAQVYVEGSVAALTAKSSSDGVNTETKPSAFSGLVGYNVHPNVDVEGYLGLGAGKSSITENGKNIGIDAKVKSSFGVFVKPKVMVSPEVEVFGRLGFLENKYEASAQSGNASNVSTQGSFAFGVGANYYFDKRTYVTGSYMNYHNKDGLKVNGLSIGVGYKF
jgi:opacity protein-like surface antigen